MTVWPGVAVAGLAAAVMVSAGVRTGTAILQPALPLPGGQLLPGAAEAAATARSLSPVAGSCTVAVKVMVTVPPGARSPVQVSTGLA